MLPRGSALIIAGVLGLLAVHLAVALGGSFFAAVFCTFALMIGAPVAILIWFGSLTDRNGKLQAQRTRMAGDKADATLWQQTIEEARASSSWSARDYHVLSGLEERSGAEATAQSSRLAAVASALAQMMHEGKRISRPILGLCFVIISAAGFSGCGVPAEAWSMIRPGMGTAELVSIAGGPDYVRSNGTNEVWQYCRDFYGRDEGRYARYYTTVLVSNQTVQDVRPYPVMSSAGCEDFYRANF
ncbi:Lipoprotein SmpA/OmlA domain-containing protein [Hyphomicrobium sp. 1Nfss2.1]|uniref:hypothetical protein n=1 Tax=Hyphomicrobium sp. 1Nfss2.1 TaxID=3413936 RepID=UPI003C7BC682